VSAPHEALSRPAVNLERRAHHQRARRLDTAHRHTAASTRLATSEWRRASRGAPASTHDPSMDRYVPPRVESGHAEWLCSPAAALSAARVGHLLYSSAGGLAHWRVDACMSSPLRRGRWQVLASAHPRARPWPNTRTIPGPTVGGQHGKSGTTPLPRDRARRRPHSPQLRWQAVDNRCASTRGDPDPDARHLP